MRTGMSWCAAMLIVAALVAGHRQWGRSASAGPPATLPKGQPSAPSRAIPHRDRALKAVAADDEFSPQELRPQRPEPGVSPADEAQIRAIIEQELSDAPQEERDIFFDRLKSLPAVVARDILSVRRQVGSANENSPFFAPTRDLAMPSPLAPGTPLTLTESPTVRPSRHIESLNGAAESLREAIQWHRHNLLNSLTPGFRRIRVLLVDRTSAGETIQPGIELAPPVLDVTPGEFEETGRPLDVALEGAVWLAVQIDGAERFTRCGALLINGDRRLATVASAGQATLQTEILVPDGVEQVVIEADGRILGSMAGAEPQMLGRLPLVTFVAPELLQPVGGTLLAATARSGLPCPVVLVDGSERLLVRPRCLELSNVDVELERNNIRVLTEQLASLEQPTHPLASGNRGRISEVGLGAGRR